MCGASINADTTRGLLIRRSPRRCEQFSASYQRSQSLNRIQHSCLGFNWVSGVPSTSAQRYHPKIYTKSDIASGSGLEINYELQCSRRSFIITSPVEGLLLPDGSNRKSLRTLDRSESTRMSGCAATPTCSLGSTRQPCVGRRSIRPCGPSPCKDGRGPPHIVVFRREVARREHDAQGIVGPAVAERDHDLSQDLVGAQHVIHAAQLGDGRTVIVDA